MRKFLLSAGLAIAAIIGLNMHTSNAYACDDGSCGGAGFYASHAGALILPAIWVGVLGKAVYDDIQSGGLHRKVAEVVPGAGYDPHNTVRSAQLVHEYNVAMGYKDDVQTASVLASVTNQ